MKCKTLEIKTNGTVAGTKFLIDGKQIENIQNVEFEADNETFPRISIRQTRFDKTGKPIERILKIRDEKTLKFIDKKTVETDPIVLEFEALGKK